MQQVLDPPPGGRCRTAPSTPTFVLSWLALLLARVTETPATTAGRSCARNSTGSPSAPSPPGSAFRLRTAITDAQLDILTKLAIDPPPRIGQQSGRHLTEPA